MQNIFNSYFEQVCKIQKKWENINVTLKKGLPSFFYHVEAIGPFAYFNTSTSNNNDFILFMPDFSPVNQNESTIILQPNIDDVNLRYMLVFSNTDDTGNFLKYWYDSLILVEDMLRTIVLKKYPYFEKILTYNKKARIFQEVVCVLQAISTLVVFQTQVFNGAVMTPGVSVEITKDFVPGIVTPLNTIVPPNKRLYAFYISGKKKNEKYYFVCPNKESLMRWLLILHGLACQSKYTEKAIDEQSRYTLLIEKINNMIKEVNPDALPQKNEKDQIQSEESKDNENNTDKNNSNENTVETTSNTSAQRKVNKQTSKGNNNDNKNSDNEDEERDNKDKNNDKDEKSDNENSTDNDISDKDDDNSKNDNNVDIQEEEEENSIDDESKSQESNPEQLLSNESNNEKSYKNPEDNDDSKKKEIIVESPISKENGNSGQNESNAEFSEAENPATIRNLIGIESILPDSIEFSNNEEEKPQVFETEEFISEKSKKPRSIIDNKRNNNKNNSVIDIDTNVTNEESILSSSAEDKKISMINPNAYDENADYYYNMWFEKRKDKSNQPPEPPQPIPTINTEVEKQIKTQLQQSQQFRRGRQQRYNSASSSLISSSYISTSSCISTDDEPMDVSDDESQGGVLNELGARIYTLVSEKDASGAIAEAIAATSDEKPINEDEFNKIIDELKNTEVKKTNESNFTLPSIEYRQYNYSKDDTATYFNNAINLFKKDEENESEDESELHFFDDGQFDSYEVMPFDKILTNSIEKVTVQDKVNFDFFEFSKLPTCCSDFDPSLLNAYNAPSSPYFTDLMIEINNVLKVDKKDVVTNESARKFTQLLSVLFLNGLQEKVNFYDALKKLQDTLSLIIPIVQSIRESDPPHLQSLSFVTQLLERNLLFLVFREIQRNDEWIKTFYLPSSLMLYGSQLTDIVEELSKLRGYEFRLSISSSTELAPTDSNSNISLKANLSSQIVNAVNTISNAVISSASSLNISNESIREYNSIVEKYGNIPAFPFVQIDDCDGSPDDTVKMFIQMLQEGQSSKSLIISPERNAWKFIGEVAEIDNNNRMTDLEIFKNKYEEFKGASFIEANRNIGQKMFSFVMEGYKLKKLHIWFLILSVNKNITNKYYNPDSSIIDMFRIRHVVLKLMQIMNKI